MTLHADPLYQHLLLTAEKRFWRIVLKKSFSPGKRKFLGPLMRFGHRNVRDHIISVKNDHRPAYRHYEALQR
jgi:hypothetical protein